MLRALRPSGRPTALRRLVAAVLWSVLGMTFGAEPLLADVCDGDAPASAAASVVPHTDGATRVAALTVATKATLTAVDTSTGSSGADAPEHVVHVCHCTHAHGGTLVDGYGIIARTRPAGASVSWRPDRLPPSPALEPRLRPPALPHAA